jgi:hypothetical protein
MPRALSLGPGPAYRLLSGLPPPHHHQSDWPPVTSGRGRVRPSVAAPFSLPSRPNSGTLARLTPIHVALRPTQAIPTRPCHLYP